MLVLHKAKWIFDAPSAENLRAQENSALAVEDGRIVDWGPYSKLSKKYPKAKTKDHGSNSILTPGFVDGHIHAPQMEMMGSAGFSLLEWLDNHTFPTEAKYAKVKYAKKQWDEFCQALLKCGTTSAAIYATSHTASTDALLEIAHGYGLRAHVGKVLMDQNAPEDLTQPAEEALSELEVLIQKWNKKKNTRVRPSITVRFAPTSSVELLRGSGKMAQKFPRLSVQTHLGETQDEIAWVKELFPKSKHYTDVYDSVGLVTSRSLLAHGIYLNEQELDRISKAQSHLVHCPSSNFFLGSGLFPYRKVVTKNISVCMGSDVGAGWDPSLQTTARCCYEAQALQRTFLKPSELLYLITRAGARALGYGEDLGTFDRGSFADFVVHNINQHGLFANRAEHCESAEELLSALLFLGGQTNVKSTYIEGDCCYRTN